jgi:CIC family chloride channel protein
VQICAAIASLLGRVFDLSRESMRSLVPVGAAAGLAAAFNTPIAAVTFTLEEILGDTAAKPLGSIVIASVIASVVERSLLGEHPLFIVPPYRLVSASEVPFYLLLGMVAGLAAVAFNVSLLRLRSWFGRQRKVPAWATPAAGGVAIGIVGLVGLLLTGSSSIFGVGYQQLAAGLQGGMTLKVMLILGVLKLAATVVSYSAGSSGGIFGPSLYIGGMLGGVVGILANTVLSDAHAQPGAFVLIGMGALFAGTVRAPITSIVIIFEMTNNYSMILPLMAANITSYAIARRLSPTPIYDALLLQDGLHLPDVSTHPLRQIRVAAAMSRRLVTVIEDWTAEEAQRHLLLIEESHHVYPVVNDQGRLLGMLNAKEISRALESDGRKKLADLPRLPPVHAHPDHGLDTVLVKLGGFKVSTLPVVSREDPTKLLGVISMRDVAEAMARTASNRSD